MEHHEIHGRDVYVVESHHHVLVPWARHRPDESAPPFVISLDYHTDGHPPFRSASRFGGGAPTSGWKDCEARLRRERFLSQLDPGVDATICEAIKRLKHDEHVATAIATRIVTASFTVCFQADRDHPRSNRGARLDAMSLVDWLSAQDEAPELLEDASYPKSDNGMYYPGYRCIPECQKETHDRECARLGANAALETSFLANRLAILDKMAKCNQLGHYREPGAYILDIDLDYFRTCRSVAPQDHSLFFSLVRGAVAITVAREAGCVAKLALDDGLNSRWLEGKLFELLGEALKPVP